ncbi:MAG TPA: hypothetical protein VEX36_11015 [Thermoleophilaceae bacterium]|nr:hypothetical protein [Thermoleophilaceae bacterium]
MLEFYCYYRMPIWVTLLAAMGVGAAAGLGDWSVGAFYGGMFAVSCLFFLLAHRVDVARDRNG